MFTARMFDAIAKLPPPQLATAAGELLLSNGDTLQGKWVWHTDIGIVDFVDGAGKRWLIDVASILAYSPEGTPVATHLSDSSGTVETLPTQA